MGQEAKKLSRRDLFKVGTAVAGAALLHPSVVNFAISQRKPQSPGPDVVPDVAEAPATFPRQLRPLKLKQPNVVLMVLDTVRADHLSCYGYHRETSPNIDAFAAGSRLYKNTLSPNCWTLASHASLFTGLSCSAHGTDLLHRRLDQRFETLAEQLGANGYQTVGLSSNGLLGCNLGFDRGFQTYWTSTASKEVASVGRDSEFFAVEMNSQLARWLTEKYDTKKPFFLFLNYIQAHQEYRPPRDVLQFASAEIWDRWQSKNQSELSFHYINGADLPSSQDITEMEALYDDEIRYLDRKVGELLEYFKTSGLDENTLLIITSDHGEHFGEHHRLSHSCSLYEPLVRVPLIVRYADRFKGGEEEKLVQSHDVYPTILDLAGIGWKRVPGQTCQSLLEPASEARNGISEHGELRAIQRENMKLIQPLSGKPELYDLVDDPMETRDLADQKPEVASQLAGQFAVWSGSFEHYVAAPDAHDRQKQRPSAAEIKAMRGLGYIH